MGIKLTNNAFATLAAGINSSATSITLTSGQGARFPTLTASDYFYATLIDTSNNLEIVKCTARSTDVLTVVRAQETTTARAYSTGDRIEIRITAQTFVDAAMPTPTAVSDQLNSSTGYFDLPSGTTGQRPGSPSTGMVRMNSTTGEPEWYDPANSAWARFADFTATRYEAEMLVVAGGGGCAANIYDDQPGAGGGGVIYARHKLTPGVAYTVVVGAGGSGGAKGVNSSVTHASLPVSLVALGGGFGGHRSKGGGGGSGSGAGGFYLTSDIREGGPGTPGQGYSGGASTAYRGAGGGGGGGRALDTGTGGPGFEDPITGAQYAGGGGGWPRDSGSRLIGWGGTGGGGNANTGSGAGDNGGTNTGGGGGGGKAATSNGGSGIVIIRYLGSTRGSGGTITSSGGYTTHTFTSSGTYTG